ncbi:hypothetical protein E3N88_10829 [Mikania micrantha]|uniref:BHLH domain-containing protein n=1 Tax=Mikania micrantha TaxID=192012 RepID=A0A5N6PCR2_9ASTR|nr:hypothetical protein E3N88_10829 [Mikania micrantha]
MQRRDVIGEERSSSSSKAVGVEMSSSKRIGAGQTRFRAFKHENGIDGSATMIVKVIACFQPLQDCQVIVMDKDFESRLLNQKTDPNLFNNPFYCDYMHNNPSLVNMFSHDATFEATQPKQHSSWFSCLSGYHQGEAFTPMVNCIEKTQLLRPQASHCGAQKKFLVFDQSNNRTTMVYTTPTIKYNLMRKDISIIDKPKDTRCSNPFLDDEINEANEMREDTEELNALLYSDDDDYDDDDDDDDEDELSTGHSPDLKMGFGDHDVEEVASSTSFLKRRKLDTGGYDRISPEDTSSSGKYVETGIFDVELGSFRASKMDKVRETINIVQNLIPGGKRSRDAMVILDEAIDYLRILKVKAKALGLDSL